MVSKTKKKHAKRLEHSWPRVWLRLIDGFFNLINTNRIYPLFGVLGLFLTALVVWKLPSSDLGIILTTIVNEFIVNKGGLIAIIVVTNLAWMYIFNRMREIYTSEIDRLSGVRSSLMHNNDSENEQATNIGSHRSTNNNCKETHILPMPDTKGETT